MLIPKPVINLVAAFVIALGSVTLLADPASADEACPSCMDWGENPIGYILADMACTAEHQTDPNEWGIETWCHEDEFGCSALGPQFDCVCLDC